MSRSQLTGGAADSSVLPGEGLAGLAGKKIVLGVSGSIAAYKACALASLLVKAGCQVQPVLTRGGARFVTPDSFSALCGRPTLMDAFDQPDPHQMTHIQVAEDADAFVLAPASANLIARLAAGMADDMLTLLLTVTRALVLLAPAMNTNMWLHPMVQANVRRLEEIGYQLVSPGTGRMACGTVGAGKLAEPEEIAAALAVLLGAGASGGQAATSGPLHGVRVLVTAGPTREPVDAVRYLSNRSSGKMGYHLAAAARDRGAAVVLVTGPTVLPPPDGLAEVVRVETARQMLQAVEERVAQTQVVIGAAAVADYRVERPLEGKLKRTSSELALKLVANPDILAEIGRRKGHRIHVGFAAEMGDPTVEARRKLAAKNLDLIVANDVSAEDAGFDVDTNRVVLIEAGGQYEALPLLPKSEVAARIIERVAALLAARRATPAEA